MVVLHSPHDDGAQCCSVLHMDILPKSFYLDKMTKVQIIEYEMNVKWKLCCHYAWDHFSNSTKRGKEKKKQPNDLTSDLAFWILLLQWILLDDYDGYCVLYMPLVPVIWGYAICYPNVTGFPQCNTSHLPHRLLSK